MKNGNGVIDGDEDYDNDDLTNLEEQECGSDPTCYDSDYDGLSDIDEVKKYKTNPDLIDTDDDVPDGDEIKLGLDPLNKETYGIPDSEYTVEQTVSKERLEEFNDKNAYQLGIKIKSSGNADEQIDIMQSRYESCMEAFGAMAGKTLSIQYETDFKVDEMELTFQIDSKELKNLPKIAVLELNKKSDKGANIYAADNGTPWAVTKKQATSLMNKIAIGETGTINQIDGLEKARNLTFRNNAKKYMIMITDQGIAKKQVNESGVKNIKQMSERLKKDNISVSVVCPTEKEKQFKHLIEKTKGISVDLTINFHYYLYKWIIATKEIIAFQAILPDKLLMYSSEKIPQRNNGKIDTDKDGLSDGAEINWTWIKGSGKKMKFPDWNTYLKKIKSFV